MEHSGTVIYVVDDDESIRRAMSRLMKSAGLKVQTFSSARSFLESRSVGTKGCIIADLRMPCLGGLELATELKLRGCLLPIIIVTAFDTEEARIAARSAEVVGFFRKPVDAQALLDAVYWASLGCGENTAKETN